MSLQSVFLNYGNILSIQKSLQKIVKEKLKVAISPQPEDAIYIIMKKYYDMYGHDLESPGEIRKNFERLNSLVLSDLFQQVSQAIPYQKYYQDNWEFNIEPNEVDRIGAYMSIHGLKTEANRNISQIGLVQRSYNFQDVNVSGPVTNEFIFTNVK